MAAMRPPRPSGNNRTVLGGLVVFLGLASMLPFYLHDRQRRLTGNLYASDKPLSGNQIMRGPYINTGSKDVGPDPNWDHATGRCARTPPRAWHMACRAVAGSAWRKTRSPLRASALRVPNSGTRGRNRPRAIASRTRAKPDNDAPAPCTWICQHMYMLRFGIRT
jgi:hypothetical protein